MFRLFFPQHKLLIPFWGIIVSLSMGCASPPQMGDNSPAAWRKEMQPPLSESDRTQLSRELTLACALPLAATRNPAIKSSREQWLAAIHVAPQATSLPDPMVQFGYQFDSVETRVGPQRFNTGLTQQIPWWQKLWSKGKIAEIQAGIAQLRYEAALRDIFIQVKDSYYELYYLDKALTITKKIASLLNNEALLAYQELHIGGTQLHEAFKAESWAAQLAYDRILLTEQRASQAERMRSLLNLPPDTEIGPVLSCPVYKVSEEIDPLYQRAESYAEILKIRGFEIEKSQYNLFLAKLSRIPDISLGLNLIETGPSRTAGIADSGKNPFMGLFSMNLPIWEQRTQALIKEKEAAEQAARQQAMNETNQIRMAVAKTFFAVDLTERLTLLYQKTLLPQAEAVMKQAEIYFRNDQASFSNLIEVTLAYHNFQLAYHRALADHGQSIGRLEQVLGTTADTESNAPLEQE